MLEPRNESTKGINEQTAQPRELDDEQLLQYLAEYFRAIPKDGTKVIALIGGPASGKSTLADKLAGVLGKTAVLGTDAYLKGDRDWRRANIEDKGLNPLLKYDPDFLNEQITAIKVLQEGQKLGIPKYNGNTGIAISQDPNNKPDVSTYGKSVEGPQDFVIIEGDFQFLDPKGLDRLVFLEADDSTRLENRIFRDRVDRGEQDEGKIKVNFESRQQTQFVPYTLPQREMADLVIKVHAVPLAIPTRETQFKYLYNIETQTPGEK